MTMTTCESVFDWLAARASGFNVSSPCDGTICIWHLAPPHVKPFEVLLRQIPQARGPDWFGQFALRWMVNKALVTNGLTILAPLLDLDLEGNLWLRGQVLPRPVTLQGLIRDLARTIEAERWSLEGDNLFD